MIDEAIAQIIMAVEKRDVALVEELLRRVPSDILQDFLTECCDI